MTSPSDPPEGEEVVPPEVQSCFERTVRTLLNTKPKNKALLARRARSERLIKKLGLVELERLATLCEAYNSMPADDAEWDEISEKFFEAQPQVARALRILVNFCTAVGSP